MITKPLFSISFLCLAGFFVEYWVCLYFVVCVFWLWFVIVDCWSKRWSMVFWIKLLGKLRCCGLFLVREDVVCLVFVLVFDKTCKPCLVHCVCEYFFALVER